MSVKTVPIILFGFGGVGRELAAQLMAARATTAARNRLRFVIAGLVDSRGWLWNPAGLSDEQISQASDVKKKGRPLSDERPVDVEIIERATAAGLEEALVVDVTAAAGMEPVIDRALEHGYGVVLANKKPLAGPWPIAQHYFNQPRLRYESTVGGGQPVIATLNYLLDANDPPRRISGQISGTLGYICRRLDDGTPFSRALAEAKAKGFTEPDPREDLGGLDARRKLLILGRMLGWPMEESDVAVEALYPPALAHLTTPEFMAAAVSLDPSLKDRVEAAGRQGARLRYVAELAEGRGALSLQPIPQESPLANMKYISFETAIYDSEPLTISGKAAGVAMTAAGVMGDMVALANNTA